MTGFAVIAGATIYFNRDYLPSWASIDLDVELEKSDDEANLIKSIYLKILKTNFKDENDTHMLMSKPLQLSRH